MQGLADFLGGPQLPTRRVFTCSFGHGIGNALDIDDRMTGKDLWQTVRQIAGQAFTRALGELHFEIQGIPPTTGISKRDIVAALVCIPEQRLKKFVCPFGRKNRCKFIRGKNLSVLIHGPAPDVYGWNPAPRR